MLMEGRLRQLPFNFMTLSIHCPDDVPLENLELIIVIGKLL